MFPTRVGINRGMGMDEKHQVCVPHTCGDKPFAPQSRAPTGRLPWAVNADGLQTGDVCMGRELSGIGRARADWRHTLFQGEYDPALVYFHLDLRVHVESSFGESVPF